MTANLVFVLNLITATVIRFYKKKKSESEIWLHTQSKVPWLELFNLISLSENRSE